MTRYDIIRMAREAGIHVYPEFEASFERFAALVAAAERKACAKVCEEEICACCWEDDAQAAAEHLAEAIRNRGKHE